MASVVFQGVCYAFPSDALVAFKQLYPIIGETNYTSYVSGSISSSGLISYSLSTRAITSDTVYSRSGSMQLVGCNAPDVPYDYTGAGEIWAFFFSFTVCLWFVAKNAGLIVNAVKRF